MNTNPYQVVRDFEGALCEYTGAPYAVTVNSCTMALLLATKWNLLDASDRPEIEIPARTYVSVPMSILHAGGRPVFRDDDWSGYYQLEPLPVFDSARFFTSGMFQAIALRHQCRPMVCVSFHASKVLGDTQGGAILHDHAEADRWLRRMRFDGRSEGVTPSEDVFRDLGYHCYMSPDVAARLMLRLHSLPMHNPALPNDDYPDLSAMEIFK